MYAPHVASSQRCAPPPACSRSGRASRPPCACSSSSPCKGLTLQALLVNTVQRLPRYTLLLKEIKHTSADAGSAGGDVRKTLNLALEKILAVGERGARGRDMHAADQHAHARLAPCLHVSSLTSFSLRVPFATQKTQVNQRVGDLEGRERAFKICHEVSRRDDLVKRVTHDIKRKAARRSSGAAVGYRQRAALD